MTERMFFDLLLLAMFGAAGITFFVTGRVSAPYGRHHRVGWGPQTGPRLGWFLMEAPALVVFILAFASGPRSGDLVPRLFALLWLIHYAHRGLLHPILMRPPEHRRMPWIVVGLGFAFNVANGYLNGRSLTMFGPAYALRWLLSFRFLYGLLLFVTGFVINRWADLALRRLRTRNQRGYAIPRGGLFEAVSCPNYLGELVQWLGFAVMTWSGAGWCFATFTAANLVPRAVAHHAWYRRTFPDYPSRRRAVIPHVL